jgi:glycosyltransferase involved in cell wall biosynthesis
MSVSSLLSDSKPVLSIVVPLWNEAAVMEETYSRLKKSLDQLSESYEIVFVDDGSTDHSRAILAAKARSDPAVRFVGLSRNVGHEMATTAGLQLARGQAAIVMDADLQDPPELFASFLAKWREGDQVVYGIRQERQGESLLKKATSFLFYRLMARIADAPWHSGPDFRNWIDDPNEVQGKEHIQAYFSILGTEPGWDHKLDQARVQLICVQCNAPLTFRLAEQSKVWQERYRAPGWSLSSERPQRGIIPNSREKARNAQSAA